MRTTNCTLDNLLTVENIMEIFHCKQRKAYKIIQIDGFPYIRIGGRYYVPSDKLCKWFEANYNKCIDLD